MESGHKLSRHELRVEQRDSVASLTPSEEKVDKGGRTEETREEKWVGERLRRRLDIGQQDTYDPAIIIAYL